MNVVGIQNKLPPRRRSVDTRREILLAARRVFSERPYTEVSLKQIAAEVGVSAPLIIKYFGTKENLFESQLDFSAIAEKFTNVPFAEFGEYLTRAAATSPAESPNSIVHRLADSGGNRHIVEALGRVYREQVVDWLVTRIQENAPGFVDGGGRTRDDAEMRAEAAMSMLAGLSLMRRLVTEDFFATDRVDTFIAYYGSLVQGVLDGGSDTVQ
ncbi:TetR family transcriptional regulator [Corynebacterium terpenotabidum Y-11]|uniref:TetR family transcriptional regulator n=1 Tax=Corynebacterium terpenotabidum Y-11 TaxID=1200352 RepID=S4XBZ2_9CORY|nr:TetR family transcriptional regulator [Corynebacterium terpenotabidum Y-11]